MGTAIVVTSGKGGVGKSTVSLGLASQFAAGGERVLLLDCDAGLRSLDRMTGTEEALVFDSSDVVAGRCAPADAIYPCVTMPVMLRLVPLLKRYFDRVILDSPAGVGRGFRAAAAAADCALIVCNSDPVCIRDASIVRRLLTELEVPQQRLVINRFNAEYFGSLSAGREDAGGLRDLDDVIDQSGVRLIGIVPEDRQMTAAFQRGCVPADDLPGMTALSRIAARMNGVSVPLSL